MSKKHEISLQTAVEMTTRFRSHKPEGLPRSEAFEVGAVQKLLSAGSTAFLRIYYGMKSDGSVHAILVAADSSGNDLLPSEEAIQKNEEGDEKEEPILLEDAFRCPHWCPEGSPLDA